MAGAALDRFEGDLTLSEAGQFVARLSALDRLELQTSAGSAPPNAEPLRQNLVEANEKFFARLLSSIRSKDRSTVRQYFKAVDQQIARGAEAGSLGYDELDALVNGLLQHGSEPGEPEAMEPDMVGYQPTPARIVLKLIEELQPATDEVFYDLGSGLGHVPILVNLLTDLKTRGVEREAAYVRYANDCLTKLGLSEVEFIRADARHVDLSDGTIFYLYTPFRGEMLRQVLRKLEAQAERRPTRVCTYGPCTSEVSRQPWLRSIHQSGQEEGRLGIFASS
jgi:hypothetical protein